MTVVIVGEAEREFAESVAYYEAKEAGLGWRFRTEVVEAVGWIERNARLAEGQSVNPAIFRSAARTAGPLWSGMWVASTLRIGYSVSQHVD